MKAVYDACHSAGVPAPREVVAFFGNASPKDRGMAVEIEGCDAVKRMWFDESREGFEIELGKLPSDISVIRFYNAW
jgi:hypothetical protein